MNVMTESLTMQKMLMCVSGIEGCLLYSYQPHPVVTVAYGHPDDVVPTSPPGALPV